VSVGDCRVGEALSRFLDIVFSVYQALVSSEVVRCSWWMDEERLFLAVLGPGRLSV
jgi:hypothetical protein